MSDVAGPQATKGNPPRVWWQTWRGIALCAAVMLALCWSLAGRNDFWYDELFTHRLAQRTFPEIVLSTSSDVHPPLFYILLQPFSGGSEWLQRVPSGAFMAGAVFLGGVAIARVLGWQTGLAWAVLMALSPLMVRYGAEARQYALANLCMAISVYAMARLTPAWRAPSDDEPSAANHADEHAAAPASGLPAVGFLALYAVGLLGGLYTHNLMTLVSAALAAMALLLAVARWRGIDGRQGEGWRPLVAWLLVHALVAVAYLPWFSRVLFQAEINRVALAWMPPPTVEGLFRVLSIEAFGTAGMLAGRWQVQTEHVVPVVGAVGVLAGLVAAWQLGGRRRVMVLGAFVLSGSVAIAAAVMSLGYVRVFFPERFATLTASSVLLVWAVLLTVPYRRWHLRVLAALPVLAIVAIAGLPNLLALNRKPLHFENREAIALVTSRTPQPPVAIAFSNHFMFDTFEHYRHRFGPQIRLVDLQEQALGAALPQGQLMWVVIVRQAWVMGVPDARAAALLLRENRIIEELEAWTFEAFLVEGTLPPRR